MAEVFGPPQTWELESLSSLAGEAGVPNDYLEFLTETGGGRPMRSSLTFASPWMVETTNIRLFQPLWMEDKPSKCVLGGTEAMRADGFLPPTAFFIAEDSGGNGLVLSAEPDDFGSVYFWDHERAFTEQVHTGSMADFANTMTRVAGSITELLVSKMMTEEEGDALADELTSLPLPPKPPPPVLESDGRPTRPRGVKLDDIGSLDDPPAGVYVYETGGSTTDSVYPRALGGLKANTEASLIDGWEPPETEWVEDDSDMYDTISCNRYLLLRVPAGERLEPVLSRYGELLPFTAGEDELLAFKCHNLVDALAPEAELVEGRNGFVDVVVPRFKQDLGNAGIFTVPQQPHSATLFFTPDVVRELMATGLRLRSFTRIWVEGD